MNATDIAVMDLRRRTEIIPGKHSGIRIKYLLLITRFKNKAVAFEKRPWPLHNRYTRMGTCIPWGMAVTVTYQRLVAFIQVTLTPLSTEVPWEWN